MKNLWAGWRIKFVKQKNSKGCIFCKKSKSKNDKKNYVIYRAKYSFIMLNIYPYSNGHLMIAPYKHIKDLNQLKNEELFEIFDLTRKMVKIIYKTHKIDGCNIGINLGKASGAGIADHIHIHLVPRWLGDTNFMPVVANTKVIPESLDDTYKILSKEVKNL